MANHAKSIQPELDDILRAIYGEQVRGSIHSAIKKMWDDLEYAVVNQLITVDSTLTQNGSGADAAVVGQKFINTFMSRGDPASGTDLNSLTEPGYYRLLNSRSFTNIPTGFGTDGLLLVFPMGSFVHQMLFHHSGSNHLIQVNYARRYDANDKHWSSWIESVDGTLSVQGVAADAAVVGSKLETSFMFRGDLIGVDLNDLTQTGYYRLPSGKTFTNLPTGFTLPGMLLNFPMSGYIHQLLLEHSSSSSLINVSYARRYNKDNSTWSEWSSSIDSTLSQQGAAADAKAVGDKITEIEAIISYVPIEISSFSVNPATVEIGKTITSAIISYACNTVPKTLTLDGSAIAAQKSGTVTQSSLSLTSDKTFTLVAKDSGSPTSAAKTVTKTVTMRFYNNCFWGVATAPEEINSEFVRGLSQKELTGSKARTFTLNGGNAGNGRYIWYASPVRLGKCSFNVGGFDGGFEPGETVSITNASGYTEDYYVYRSTNDGLGSVTVIVS